MGGFLTSDGATEGVLAAATAARQDTGNASLSSIDSKLTSPVAVEIEGHLANGVGQLHSNRRTWY